MWKPTDTSARQMVHSSTLDTITEHKSPRATTVKTCRPIFCLPSTISIVHHIRTPLWYPINWFFCCLRHKWLQLQLFIIILHNHLYSALMLLWSIGKVQNDEKKNYTYSCNNISQQSDETRVSHSILKIKFTDYSLNMSGNIPPLSQNRQLCSR